jgi:hypothetical protein
VLRAATVPIAALLAIAAVRPAEPWQLLRSSPLPTGSEADSAIRYYGVGAQRDGAARRRGSRALAPAQQRPARVADHRPRRRCAARAPPRAGSARSRRSCARHDADRLVGLGGGVHLEAIPGRVERIDVIEIESEVVAANRAIGARRASIRSPIPRVHVVVNDARSALAALGPALRRDRRAGLASLDRGLVPSLHARVLRAVDSRLADGGVFVQWMGSAFINEELLASLVATLLATWPHVQVYRPLGGDLLFAASRAPLARDADWIRGEVARDPARMAALGIASPLDVELALVLDEAGCREFAAGAPQNTDDRNWLQMRSPDLLRSRRTLASGAEQPELDRLDAIASARSDADQVYLVRRLLELGDPRRAARAAGAVAGERARAEALALAASRARDSRRSRRWSRRIRARQKRAGVSISSHGVRSSPDAAPRCRGARPPRSAA